MKKFICIILSIAAILSSFTFSVNASEEYRLPLFCPCDETCAAKRFEDVSEANWYHYYVDWAVVYHHCIDPIFDWWFGANSPLTRGECIYALWILNGKPGGFGWDGTEFEDIEVGTKLYEACIWGRNNGIIQGYGNNRFGPNDYITREQFAAMMMRCASMRGFRDRVGNLKSFVDYQDISDYAVEAMAKMVYYEYYKGNDKGELCPKKNVTCAEACAVMFRVFIGWDSDPMELPTIPSLQLS